MRTFSETVRFGRVADEYQKLREQHPDTAAVTVYRYIQDDHGLPFNQFRCEVEVGHCWPREIDERDRCLCAYCGADGDA